MSRQQKRNADFKAGQPTAKAQKKQAKAIAKAAEQAGEPLPKVPTRLYTSLPVTGREAREALRNLYVSVHGTIERPIRIERLPTRDPEEEGEKYYIEKRTKGIWKYWHLDENRNPTTYYLVQYTAKTARDRETWVCSCEGWDKNHDCAHVKRVRKRENQEEDISTARRRPETVWLYPLHARRESGRRQQAYNDIPDTVPKFAQELIKLFVDEPQRGVGRIGVTRKYAIFALLMKVFQQQKSYANLRGFLKKLPESERLALGWTSSEPPSAPTFSKRFGPVDQEFILPYMWLLAEKTVRQARAFDEMLLIDSYDIPFVREYNSRDRKKGVKFPSYRVSSKVPQVRHHFAVGSVTGIIYASHITTTAGLGSGDNNHLPALVEFAKAVKGDGPEAVELTKVAADRAYEGHRNFEQCQALGTLLFVHEKLNSDRMTSEWCDMAQAQTALQRLGDTWYKNHSRKRNLAEATPNKIKDRTRYLLLNKRWNEPPIPVGDDDQLSKKPESEIARALSAATAAVGVAPLNEMLAIIIINNLYALAMLEHLCDSDVDFKNDGCLRPPLLVTEEELVKRLDGGSKAA